ncbi:MAG: putative repeat protein (TIGR02543 family), partial [Rhodothermales bacterium]
MMRFRYILGLFFLVGPAFAYLLSQWTPQGDAPIAWDFQGQQPSAYFADGRLVYRLITSGSYAMTDADRHQNIMNAFKTWEDVPDAIVAFERGPDIVVDAETDFSIGFATAAGATQWGSNMNGAAGLATTCFDGNDHIIDADIAFDVNTAWGDDLEPTALHEIGHTLALSHSPDAQTTMSYIGPRGGTHDEIVGRRLASDDILALAFNYPGSNYLASRGSISGTIKDGNGNDIHQGQIGVFDSNDILVATTLSRLGEYKIEGLAPGSYILRAYPSQASSYLVQQAAMLAWREGTLYNAGANTYPPATPFLPAADQSQTVTAGNNATLNLTMTTGTPTMVSQWGYRDIAGGLSVKGNVFALGRGETATIGIDGTNFPTQASELNVFALSGPADITLSNQSFPGWPSANTVAYDVAVGTNAALGSRALLLENSSSEQTFVFGFVEVTDTGSIAAAQGANTPTASNINPGTRKVMQQFAMSASSEEMIRLRQFTVNHSGSGSTASVLSVEIFADEIGNGLLDGDDEMIGTGSFGGGATAEIFSVFSAKAAATENFLIVYEFDAAATASDTYQSSVTAVVANGVQSGRDISPAGLPQSGASHTVELNTDHSVIFVPSGDGSISGPVLQMVVNNGSTLAVAPQPAPNHYFTGWSGGATGTDNPLVITNVTSDLTVTAHFAFGVSNFPYGESFEGGLGAWENITGDQFDWTRNSGATVSPDTGPDAAQEGGFYMYTEATGFLQNDNAILRGTFSFTGLGNPVIEFDYHMYGAGMGSLFLEGSTDGGQNWDSLWSQSDDKGNTWLFASVPIAAYAGESSVLLQFRGMIGPDFRSDMALDGIEISDDQALTVVIDQASISENGGAGTGTVSRSGDITNALNVNLASNDNGEATVPTSITIPGAQGSTTFAISAIDDNQLDGTQTVTITAAGPSYAPGQDTIDITDEETLGLSISLAAVPENGGFSLATVTRNNTDRAAPLVVNLASDDTTEATVPATVTIPAAQGSTTFNIAAQDDALLDGNILVNITASNTGYLVAPTDDIEILDFETLTIDITETEINERNGVAVATLTRSNTDNTASLMVNISSEDTSEATVPATVTIPAAQGSTTFNVTAFDDSILDGTITGIDITPGAAGYDPIIDTIAVTDYETLTVIVNPTSISENGGSASGTVTRGNTDITAAYTVNLVSNDTSEAIVPATVEILANQTSANFTISAVDDAILDGSQAAIISTNNTPTYSSLNDSLTVTDFETLSIVIAADDMSEDGGSTNVVL